MPVDVNHCGCERLAAGIANVRHRFTLLVTRPINDTFLSCALSIIWLFLYVYLFTALLPRKQNLFKVIWHEYLKIAQFSFLQLWIQHTFT